MHNYMLECRLPYAHAKCKNSQSDHLFVDILLDLKRRRSYRRWRKLRANAQLLRVVILRCALWPMVAAWYNRLVWRLIFKKKNIIPCRVNIRITLEEHRGQNRKIMKRLLTIIVLMAAASTIEVPFKTILFYFISFAIRIFSNTVNAQILFCQ